MADGNPVIIRTKLVPPVREVGLVARERLLRKLSDTMEHNLVVVKAPAGYGKTIAVGQWFASLDPATEIPAWYSVDSSDNDLGRFFTYLVAALQQAIDGFGSKVLDQLNAGVRLSAASLGGAFLNEVVMLDNRVSIVLDDFHVIRNTQILDAVAQIVSDAPNNFRLIIISREAPQFGLGRIRALGRLAEITSDELRFSGVEIHSLMSLAGHREISSGQIHRLGQQTEGWAAGLQLASIALSNSASPAEFISTFSGNYRDVTDFLLEDVLHGLDIEIRQFLLQTSILERLSPSLCDAVTGVDNGRRMLDILESKSLFMFSLDSERHWYRYHHLFSEVLRNSLDVEYPERSVLLHDRASDWFADNDCVEEAIQHALEAQDMGKATLLLDRACDALFYSGRLGILDEWYKQIPESNLRKCPRILLDQAWSLILEWKFSAASEMLNEVREVLEEKEATGLPPSELVDLRAMLKHREMMYALFRDDMPLVAHLCQEMLEDFPLTDPYLKGNLLTCLLYAQREMFDYRNANEFDALSMQLYEEAQSRWVIIWHNSILGPTELERGDLDRAEESLALGLSIASEISGELSPLAAMPGILLAEVLYERNQLDDADDLLSRYLQLADQIGFVDQLIAGYVCRARRLVATGSDTGAKRVLREAEALAIKWGFPRFGMKIKAECARQALLARDVETGKQMFVELFGGQNTASFYPKGGSTTIDATRALTWCRLARFEGHSKEMSTVCRKWIRFAKNHNALRTNVQFSVLHAHILQQSGDSRASLRALRNALIVGMQTGMVRTIVDEMENSQNLLQQFIDGQVVGDDPILIYAEQLATIIAAELGHTVTTSTSKVAPIGTQILTERERDILKMVESGLLNREIANSLGLTEGSVKWYLQQTYDKIGIRRRAQAARRAKELGFID